MHNDVAAYVSRRSDLESEAVECIRVQFNRSTLDTPLLIVSFIETLPLFTRGMMTLCI